MVQIKIDLYMSYYEKVDRHAIIQNDNEGVALVCSLKNPDGTICEVPEGASVLFVAAKPDGKGVILSTDDEQVAYDGNIVTVTIPQSVTAVKGLVLCKLIIQETEKTASSQVFRLSCEGDLIPGDLIESVEYQSLVTMLNHLGAREAEFDDMKAQFIEAISGITEDSEVINARVDGPYSTTHDTLKLRLDAMSALLKGVVDGDFENRVSDLEDEVETARGEFDALADRLAGIDTNASDLENTKLKVIRLEQEVKRYKELYEQSNPTQSPRVTSTGYGVVSLPKNAAEGQISASVKGVTATNLIKNGNFADGTTKWVNNGNESFTVSDNVLSFIPKGKDRGTYQAISVTAGHKYYYSLQARREVLPAAFYVHFIGGSSLFEETTEWQTKTNINTAIEDGTPMFKIQENRTENYSVDAIQIKNLYMVDLTATFGAGNEPTKDECDQIFANYFDGTKSTVSTSRLKSVGKNLFDRNNHNQFTFIKGGGSFVEHEGVKCVRVTRWSRENRIVFKGEPNTRYTVTVRLKVETSTTSMGITFFYDDGTMLDRFIPSQSTFTTMPSLTSAEGKTLKEIGFGSNANLEAFIDLDSLQIEKGTAATPYEPYKYSEQYVNGPELRSLPNGTKDEISTDGVRTQRNGYKVLQDSDVIYMSTVNTNLDYAVIPKPSDYIYANVSFGDNGAFTLGNYPIRKVAGDAIDSEAMIGKASSTVNPIEFRVGFAKGTTLADARTALAGTALTYQLAMPVEIPIQVSGSLHSYPSGTVYVEPAIADVGVYSGGVSILNTDYPIHQLESISKIDFDTGLPTEIDASTAVIAPDGLTFTHSALSNGDIVFFTYLYDDIYYTEGKLTCEYYDSRYVLKDDVTGKYYRKVETVEDGELVTQLVEV